MPSSPGARCEPASGSEGAARHEQRQMMWAGGRLKGCHATKHGDPLAWQGQLARAAANDVGWRALKRMPWYQAWRSSGLEGTAGPGSNK
eukprot:364072-Chlamydomonas_euryale.AAC.15